MQIESITHAGMYKYEPKNMHMYIIDIYPKQRSAHESEEQVVSRRLALIVVFTWPEYHSSN